MPRSAAFSVGRKEPFADHPNLSVKPGKISGPFSWLNPTRARFAYNHSQSSSSEGSSSKQLAHGVEYKWRSRDNRKGRHTIVVDPEHKNDDPSVRVPESTSNLKGVLRGILRMFTSFPYWDISFLAAFFFTWGSVVFVINGFFVWLPLVAPSTTFPTESVYGGGITAFIGTCIFQTGAVCIILEAFNENQAGCFGWALEELKTEVEDGRTAKRLAPEVGRCAHHHQAKDNLVSSKSRAKTHLAEDTDGDGVVGDGNDRKWVWLPTWSELKNHYFHELGFLASMILASSATTFWMLGFTGLPGVFSSLSTGLADGVYWAPGLVGSIGFIVSSLMFMLETQVNWYTPSFHVLGWHIGMWNTIGSVGFAMSAALGYCPNNSKCVYQSSLSTTWGSIAFLVGSMLQLYESLDKYPVEHRNKEA